MVNRVILLALTSRVFAKRWPSWWGIGWKGHEERCWALGRGQHLTHLQPNPDHTFQNQVGQTSQQTSFLREGQRLEQFRTACRCRCPASGFLVGSPWARVPRSPVSWPSLRRVSPQLQRLGHCSWLLTEPWKPPRLNAAPADVTADCDQSAPRGPSVNHSAFPPGRGECGETAFRGSVAVAPRGAGDWQRDVLVPSRLGKASASGIESWREEVRRRSEFRGRSIQSPPGRVSGRHECGSPAALSWKVDAGDFLMGAGETGGAAPGWEKEWVGKALRVRSCNSGEKL
ncbi:hypothetical protein NN561_003145 [Cricetulus griseus]